MSSAPRTMREVADHALRLYGPEPALVDEGVVLTFEQYIRGARV